MGLLTATLKTLKPICTRPEEKGGTPLYPLLDQCGTGKAC